MHVCGVNKAGSWVERRGHNIMFFNHQLYWPVSPGSVFLFCGDNPPLSGEEPGGGAALFVCSVTYTTA